MQLFIHIPKTAGTSLRDRLAEHYRRRIAFDYGPTSPLTHPLLVDRQRPAQDRRVDLSAQGIELIYGHVRYPHWQATFAQEEVLAVLRHPVDRCISHYQHFLSHDDKNASALAEVVRTGQIGLAEFARHPHMVNIQARSLGIKRQNLDDLARFRGLFLSESIGTELGITRRLNQGQRSFQVCSADIVAIMDANRLDMLIYELVRQARREGYWRWDSILQPPARRLWKVGWK